MNQAIPPTEKVYCVSSIAATRNYRMLLVALVIAMCTIMLSHTSTDDCI